MDLLIDGAKEFKARTSVNRVAIRATQPADNSDSVLRHIVIAAVDAMNRGLATRTAEFSMIQLRDHLPLSIVRNEKDGAIFLGVGRIDDIELYSMGGDPRFEWIQDRWSLKKLIVLRNDAIKKSENWVPYVLMYATIELVAGVSKNPPDSVGRMGIPAGAEHIRVWRAETMAANLATIVNPLEFDRVKVAVGTPYAYSCVIVPEHPPILALKETSPETGKPITRYASKTRDFKAFYVTYGRMPDNTECKELVDTFKRRTARTDLAADR